MRRWPWVVGLALAVSVGVDLGLTLLGASEDPFLPLLVVLLVPATNILLDCLITWWDWVAATAYAAVSAAAITAGLAVASEDLATLAWSGVLFGLYMALYCFVGLVRLLRRNQWI